MFIRKVVKGKSEYSRLRCPRCRSVKITFGGHTFYKYKPKRQNYFCKNCRKYWKPQYKYKNMRYPTNVLNMAKRLLETGLSSRKIQKILQEKFKIPISYSTISNFNHKYRIYPMRNSRFKREIILKNMERINNKRFSSQTDLFKALGYKASNIADEYFVFRRGIARIEKDGGLFKLVIV